jgi:hypothetical protein
MVSTMMFIFYTILFSIISGLVYTKPIEEKPTINDKNLHDISMDEAMRDAETTLDRYYNLIESDIDQLVHAMLLIIMNNPTSFPFVPHRALDIALKNFGKKLGQSDVDILTKPILLSIEQNAQKKTKETQPIQLTDDVKDTIEDALDKFFAEHVQTN